MPFHIEYERTVPARRPEGHQPAAPRYSLRWTRPVPTLVSVYFGVQGKSLEWPAEQAFYDFLRQKLDSGSGPESLETMRCNDDAGYTNGILVAYWTDPTRYAKWLIESGFKQWLSAQERLEGEYGYWHEAIAVPYDRHETIYSGPEYRIGFSRTADSVIVPITTNGFFGAARDRLPVSAIDPLDSPYGKSPIPRTEPASHGAHLMVLVPHNVTILRSGQYWEGAGQAQLDDYMESLQPKLHRGMSYLANNKPDTGCLSLRIMTNLNEDGTVRAETSVLGAFVSLQKLEEWAATHETHLDIYRHAIAMNRLYKEKREVVTWHELFVLMQGNCFEYVNCHPATGMLPYGEVWQSRKE